MLRCGKMISDRVLWYALGKINYQKIDIFVKKLSFEMVMEISSQESHETKRTFFFFYFSFTFVESEQLGRRSAGSERLTENIRRIV